MNNPRATCRTIVFLQQSQSYNLEIGDVTFCLFCNFEKVSDDKISALRCKSLKHHLHVIKPLESSKTITVGHFFLLWKAFRTK